MSWELKEEDLKRYPHFDKFLPLEEAHRIVTDPERVRSNPFYPFIKYTRSYQPFRDDKNKPEKKIRLIRYASRRDAYIFSYYRHLISEKYEPELERLGIKDCVIAYRKIRTPGINGHGKCNIDFAKDAFDCIRDIGECSIVVLDISKYFESLDHAIIKNVWCRLFKFLDFPSDHAAVYKNITRYRVVDQEAMYERLGHIGLKEKNGVKVRGYLTPYRKMPSQICSPKDFREKIAGNGIEYPNLIEKNDADFGIPQGAPISDIIANFYLMDFDTLISSYAKERNGLYMRYSDDIIIVVPGGTTEGVQAREYVRDQIKCSGDRIQIKLSKCSLVNFHKSSDGIVSFEHLDTEAKGKNGLEYLGFRFNGEKVYLRDSTLSGFYRKITYSMRHEVRAFVARYPGKDLEWLMSNFNVEEFVKNFGRVEEFDKSMSCENWTFWTYARRAHKVFGPPGNNIIHQLKRHKSVIKKRVLEELRKRAPS